jgi:cyclopropane fatty-acyl-phospholipid synthase-like methyltransferase
MTSPDEIVSLHHDRYVRSNAYDARWVIDNQMGPNALWLAESLMEIMTIEAGMKVLDLGCGRATSSIFLAREFGAQVWATDLWIPAEENEARIHEAGIGDLVTAVHAEAHTLPFEKGFFDAIVSIDAYQYFGTADLYIGYLVDFLRADGQVGVVMPATTRELGEEIPAALAPFWEWEYCCLHSPEWWRAHWAKTRRVLVERVEPIDEGWQDWLRFNDAIAPYVEGWWVDDVATTHELLTTDQGTELGFVRLLATKREQQLR